MNYESRIKNYSSKYKIKTIIYDSPACSRLRRQPMAGRLFMIHARGFTLIELMVAISITAVLGTLGIAGFSNYNKAQVLQTSASEVVTMLNLAKSRAQSQIKLGSACNSETKTLKGYSVDISGNSYSLVSHCLVGQSELTSPIEGQVKTLSQNIKFKSPDTSPTSFFFPIQTGGATEGQIVISDDNGAKQKVITVNSLGGVTVSQ